MLAARVTGAAKTAFPDGPPGDKNESKQDVGASDAPEDTNASSQPAHVNESSKPINVIVVADVDMLHDRFWVTATNFFGQQVHVPNAHNGDLVINALENLSDGGALIGLRGRGISNRPFTLVEDIRRDAERRYRAEEQRLQDELKSLETQLNSVQRGDGDGGDVLLTAENRAALERFRAQMLSVRKELRNVQHALRRDIDTLEARVKFLNIAAVPLLLGIVIVCVLGFRYWRRHRSTGRAQTAQ
jgi:ABC-type uncharacterized transport system involved in gliding motility auxiliary subunit